MADAELDRVSGIRLTKEERKELLAELERESSRAEPAERVLQRGEQALKDGHLDQARRVLRQLESTIPDLAGLGLFRRNLDEADQEKKRHANLKATEEMLSRYVQQRKKPLAELALATLIEIEPDHPRRAEYEDWVTDLDRELEVQKRVEEQLEAGRAALRTGLLDQARTHLEALRKVDPDSPAAERLAAEIEGVAQGRAMSADIERAKQRLEELLAADRLDEAEQQMEQLGRMDLPKVTIDFLHKRLEECRRRLRQRAEAAELLALFEMHLEEKDWPRAREAAQRYSQRFPSGSRPAELFSRVNELEAAHRHQQSLEEGLATLRRFIAEGDRAGAELSLKLLAGLDLDEARLAELEARVRTIGRPAK